MIKIPIVSGLAQWEKFVYDHIRSFEIVFCQDQELISIYWGSTHMKVVYMTKDGRHITDSPCIDKWLNFMKEKKCKLK